MMDNSKLITWQQFDINKDKREILMGHNSFCIWITGLSGAGKSTLANNLENLFSTKKIHSYILDGDNLRHGLNKDLEFNPHDRSENIRRVAEVSKLMTDAGIVTIVSLISPFRKDRELARKIFGINKFIEIYVETPIEICELRDTKGLYAEARAGRLKNFTGIDSPYEIPNNPEITVNTKDKTIEECVNLIYTKIVQKYLKKL
jgi:adenylyl-sulfate kinase